VHKQCTINPKRGQPFNRLLAGIVGMENQQIDYYQLVQESDAIGLNDPGFTYDFDYFAIYLEDNDFIFWH